MKTIEAFKIADRKLTKGKYGVEVEIEGNNLPNAPEHWTREHDGSLRGRDTAEYVLVKPLSSTSVRTRLLRLQQDIKKNNGEIDDSVRAGVHIHVNMQDTTIIQLYNMMTLWLAFEPAILKLCGEGREGNLFCLGGSNSPYLLECLAFAAHTGRWERLANDNIRYSAMNAVALSRYGSLEFRCFRTPQKLVDIHEWVEILGKLKAAAMDFEQPSDIIDRASEEELVDFFYRIVGDDTADKINNLRPLLLEGVRNAQHVAYATDWNKYKENI